VTALIHHGPMKFSLDGELVKLKIMVPLKDLICMPGHKKEVNQFVGSIYLTNISNHHPQVFLGMGKSNNDLALYISLLVNGLVLHSCMLYLGYSTNVMTLKIMHELGLKISKTYKSMQAVDLREVQVCGVIKVLEVHLQMFLIRVLTMDVLVIDCPVK
jgi:hypothetical protein